VKSLSPRGHSIGLSLVSIPSRRADPGTADHAHVIGPHAEHAKVADRRRAGVSVAVSMR
jgi:hypothetical protein